MLEHGPALARQAYLELRVLMAGAPISPLLEHGREGVFQPILVTVVTLHHPWLRLVQLAHLHLRQVDQQRLRYPSPDPHDYVTQISRANVAPSHVCRRVAFSLWFADKRDPR